MASLLILAMHLASFRLVLVCYHMHVQNLYCVVHLNSNEAFHLLPAQVLGCKGSSEKAAQHSRGHVSVAGPSLGHHSWVHNQQGVCALALPAEALFKPATQHAQVDDNWHWSGLHTFHCLTHRPWCSHSHEQDTPPVVAVWGVL